jgi:hypothetical protein
MWHVWERRQISTVLVVRPVGERQLGRVKRRWEDNISMEMKGIV